MYYKVLKDGRVIDMMTTLSFVKYNPKHDIMVNCSEDEAQGVISSNGKYIWQVEGYYSLPCSGYDTVRIEKADVYEYEEYHLTHGRTPEEIIDSYTLQLIQGGVL